MGNVEAAVVRNVDKRTSRREHRAIFEAEVQRFRSAPFAAPEQITAAAPLGRNVRVCIRKRPMFPHEREQGEFDVITCLSGRVVVHDARMHPDMVHMFMNHHDFTFDEAFGETTDNDEVYAGTACKLVSEALGGGNGTVMMYGQTGSGKTYTMSAIHERVARDLFADVRKRLITVCFVELLGDNCFDMFNQGAPCTLSSAADGSVHPYPSVEVPVRTAQELLALLDLATKLRATAATGVHDQSSRSHAVCRIFIDCDSGNRVSGSEGCLTLVDLAGSEHRIDNAEHNAERRKEGAKINSSLAALKECIRATAAGAKFVAFRQNRLTQLLRGCFAGAEQHHTVVIATASPSSKDTEHSLNTLRHACIMDGQGEAKSGQSAHVAGGAVTKVKLGEINVAQIARERRAQKKNEGPKADEWVKPPPAHQSKQSNTAARAALDAKCVRALPQNLGQALLEARHVFGTERQRARMTRVACAPDAVDEQSVLEAAPSKGGGRQRARSATNEAAHHPALPARRASTPAISSSSHDCCRDNTTCETEDGGIKHGELSAENEKAFELFRLFCTRGRDAHAWRKNDLRLINSCVVRLLYGTDAQLDWSHPNLALDQLEELVSDAPPPPHFLEGPAGTEEVTARQRPKSDQRLLVKPPIIPASGSAPSTASKRPPSVSNQRCNSSIRDASLASRGVSPDPRPPVTHQDAIRARREALEKARQQSLQKALGKNQKNASLSRDDEIAGIQEQLQQKGCSAAAAVGLKKRLATLKAVALREERRHRVSLNAPHVDASDSPVSKENTPVRASSFGNLSADLMFPHSVEEEMPASAAVSPFGGTHQESISSFSKAITSAQPEDEWWPEPAKPPPRNLQSHEGREAGRGGHGHQGWPAAPCRSSAEPIAGMNQAASPSRVSTGRRRAGAALQIGAASAPWANEFSSGVVAQG